MSERKINLVNTGANFLARVFTRPSIGFLGYFDFLILVLLQTQDEKLHLSSKFKPKANVWFNSKEKFYMLVFPNYYKYSYIFAKIFGNIFSHNNKGICFQQKRLSFFLSLFVCYMYLSTKSHNKKVPRSVAQRCPLTVTTIELQDSASIIQQSYRFLVKEIATAHYFGRVF